MDYVDFQVLCRSFGCLQEAQQTHTSTFYDHFSLPQNDAYISEFNGDNLVYLRARYYNDEMGTFLSPDPVQGSMNDPLSLNGYSYVHGNPVNRTDPSGLFPIGGTQLASVLNSAFCMAQSQPISQAVDCNCHGIFAFACPSFFFPPCSTPQPPFATNTPQAPFVTNTPPASATLSPTQILPPTPTPVGDLRKKALTLAAFSEAGGLTDADRQVVLFTILNREKFPDSYDPIEQALGGSQIAGGVLDRFTGDRATQINNAYDQYSSQQQYVAAFQNAEASVTNLLASQPADFTQGAIQFAHAATPVDAQQIADRINRCGQSVIEGIIRSAGIEPIINGQSMHAGSVNVSAYINMNYTVPLAPSGAPSCP